MVSNQDFTPLADENPHYLVEMALLRTEWGHYLLSILKVNVIHAKVYNYSLAF